MKALLQKVMLTVILLTIVSFAVKAQNWSAKMEVAKAVIENKGQFPIQNKDIIKTSEVLYAFDNGQEVIYFKPTGVVYAFNQTTPKVKEADDVDANDPADYKENEKEEKPKASGEAEPMI